MKDPFLNELKSLPLPVFVAVFVGVLTFLTTLGIYLFGPKHHIKDKLSIAYARLIPDNKCANLLKWFQTDTDDKIYLAFPGFLSKNSTLDEVENLPKTDCYTKRFSDDPKSEFYFRRGIVTKIDRFTVIDNNETEFGHVECVYVKSPQLIDKNRSAKTKNKDGIVGWVYCVYIAPNMRGKGLAKHLINATVKEFEKNGVFDIRLIVVKNNQPALKTYQKCGFKFVKEVHADGGIDFLMKYVNNMES